MSAFRDAITKALVDNSRTWTDEEGDADAVLAMPEMQAIRQALLTFASNVYEDWALETPADALRVVIGSVLDPALVAWVRGGAE